MLPEKVKEFIIGRIYKDLSDVVIIHHENSVWFIDREKEYWYFELKSDGMLWWRYSYFKYLFSMFSLTPDEYRPIIIESVERVLNVIISGENLSDFHNKKRVKNMTTEVLSSVTEPIIKKIFMDMDLEYQHPIKIKEVIKNNVMLQIKEVSNCC